jgi:hypothetical protein
MKQPILALVVMLTLISCLGAASAKAAYATRMQMVKRATAIAVVDIGPVTGCKLKGHHWTYSQTGQAEVQQTLKGQLAPKIQLVASENFECAQTRIHSGRYLVFLAKEERLVNLSPAKVDGTLSKGAISEVQSAYVGCNWQASLCPVQPDGQLDWLLEPQAIFPKGRVSLESAIAQVRKDLEQ